MKVRVLMSEASSCENFKKTQEKLKIQNLRVKFIVCSLCKRKRFVKFQVSICSCLKLVTASLDLNFLIAIA